MRERMRCPRSGCLCIRRRMPDAAGRGAIGMGAIEMGAIGMGAIGMGAIGMGAIGMACSYEE